jgi:hypothetical protein
MIPLKYFIIGVMVCILYDYGRRSYLMAQETFDNLRQAYLDCEDRICEIGRPTDSTLEKELGELLWEHFLLRTILFTNRGKRSVYVTVCTRGMWGQFKLNPIKG